MTLTPLGPVANHGTAIGWTHWPGTKGETLVDTTGCDPVSPGCGHDLGPGNCYSATLSSDEGPRGLAKHPRYRGVAVNGRFTGVVHTHAEMLTVPLHHKMRRTYFHNSMSDTLHGRVADGFIAAHLAVMAWCLWHNDLNLTKRHGRLSLIGFPSFRDLVEANYRRMFGPDAPDMPWPLPNVAWGVSVEDEQRADLRMPHLVRAAEHAACVFVSAEPLFARPRLRRWMPEFPPGKLWVIAGGQSGPGHQPLDLDHAREIRDDCAEHGVPFYFKQVGGPRPTSGGKLLDGREHLEFPPMAYREAPPWRKAPTA